MAASSTPEAILGQRNINLRMYTEIEKNWQFGWARIGSNFDKNLELLIDGGYGITFYREGNCTTITNRSTERCGRNITNGLAKIISANNGDILIEAKNGTISLNAKRIVLNASDITDGSICIAASGRCTMEGATCNIVCTNGSMIASGSLDFSSASTKIDGQLDAQVTTGTDELDTSFFGKILSGIKKFKKFFNSVCG